MLFGLVFKIKGMRATFSSSLSLETVGSNPRKNLEISRFNGGAMGGVLELQTKEVLGVLVHGFKRIQGGDCVQISPNFPAPFGCLLG